MEISVRIDWFERRILLKCFIGYYQSLLTKALSTLWFSCLSFSLLFQTWNSAVKAVVRSENLGKETNERYLGLYITLQLIWNRQKNIFHFRNSNKKIRNTTMDFTRTWNRSCFLSMMVSWAQCFRCKVEHNKVI